MATCPFKTALGLLAIFGSAGTLSAQMAGYPNGGGRIPGTVATGPQFPGGSNSAASQLAPYSPPIVQGPATGPVYVSPPVYSSSSGSSAVPAFQPGSVSNAPTSPYATPATPPITTPIATPIVAPVAPTAPVINSAQQPTLAPPVVTSAASPSTASSYAPGNYNGNYNTGSYGNGTYTPPTPDFSTPPAIPQYAPNNTQLNGPVYGQSAMPPGSLNPKEITPFAKGSAPPSFSAWLPRSWSRPPSPYDNTNKNANYGAIVPNYPSVDPSAGGNCYPGEGCNPSACCPSPPIDPWYTNIGAISTLDAFKNPVDLDGQNANFGKRVGVAASFPIMRSWGFGGQISSTVAWYDWKGSQYTGHGDRYQNFTTVGLFQRSCETGLGFGIAHDWLIDEFYDNLYLSQFRVAASWQVNPCNEVGVWGALPQRRDSAFIGTPVVYNRFQSLTQGNIYWKHYWSDFATTSMYAGLAESPSDISYGGNVQVAVTPFCAVTGGFTYVLPGSGGHVGYQEEIWNLSFGCIFYPGTAFLTQRSQFRPMFAPADNGNFASWRR